MTFAYPVPWWGLVAAALACLALARAAYARTGLSLEPWQRWLLVGLRALAVAALVVCLLRPVSVLPPGPGLSTAVALIVDASRSMAIADAAGEPRLAAAIRVARAVAADVGRDFRVDIFSAGERVERASLDWFSPSGRRSDLAGAIAAIRDCYRAAPLAGIVLVSDGNDTGHAAAVPAPEGGGVPVFTVGVGGPSAARDWEVRSLTAGPSALDASLVDLTATIVAHGDCHVAVRLLQGARVLDVRDVVVPADGFPVQQTFTVAPERAAPGVYRVELPADSSGAHGGQQRSRRARRAAGPAAARVDGRRAARVRALVPEARVARGSVGHTRRRRAQGTQRFLGQDTYYVQAAPGRTGALTAGFPASREALFAYDGLVLANLEPDALTRDEQALIADFVGERGGGLLVLGLRALAAPLSAGSPLAPVLPLDLSDRRSVVRAGAVAGERLRVALTDDGARHPVMRLDASGADLRAKWAALPALAAAAGASAPRPGAAVLAMTTSATGGTVPLVTVQRYGAGRAMIFGGEASWHWKMMMPARETAYDVFWRQSLRWLTGEAPDPVALAVPPVVAPGSVVPIDVAARDASFAPVARAAVTLAVRGTDAVRDLAAEAGAPGRASARWQADVPGLYRDRGRRHRRPAHHRLRVPFRARRRRGPGIRRPAAQRGGTATALGRHRRGVRGASRRLQDWRAAAPCARGRPSTRGA